MFTDVEGDFTDRWIEDRLNAMTLILFGEFCHTVGLLGLLWYSLEAFLKVIHP